MKKSAVLSLGFLAFTLAFCGCQAPGGKASDEKLINNVMSGWKTAFEAKDLDRLMMLYSENYLSSTGSSKLAMRERMAGAIQRGSFGDVEVKLKNARLNILGDKATFEPVEVTLNRETLALEYTLQKEEGKWLIINSKRK
ncbi:MAG: nuclear transport factor 2 family protein [Sedimentisphaerales bacterium]|nr:nuclear transport factor 2 family protein [Sedimentisphaerales bacterium]